MPTVPWQSDSANSSKLAHSHGQGTNSTPQVAVTLGLHNCLLPVPHRRLTLTNTNCVTVISMGSGQ